MGKMNEVEAKKTADAEIVRIMAKERDRALAAERRIANALEIAFRWSQIDGEHHKAWAIDQMVRALTLGGLSVATGEDDPTPITYQDFVNAYKAPDAPSVEETIAMLDGEDDERSPDSELEDEENGEDGYTWNEGIAP